jgi:hypothetical protein
MLTDITCPYCHASVIQGVSPFRLQLTDTLECSRCRRTMRLSVGAIGFRWMLFLTCIISPVVFLGLAAAHLLGHPILIFSPEPWSDIALISLLAIPGGLLLVGYFTLGLGVGLAIKAISMIRSH